IPIPEETQRWIGEQLALAQTVIHFADETTLLATLAIANKIKTTSAAAVRTLREAGVDVYMLTGDNEQTAHAVAKQTGIRHYEANVLPAEKANFVKKLQAKGHIVGM